MNNKLRVRPNLTLSALRERAQIQHKTTKKEQQDTNGVFTYASEERCKHWVENAKAKHTLSSAKEAFLPLSQQKNALLVKLLRRLSGECQQLLFVVPHHNSLKQQQTVPRTITVVFLPLSSMNDWINYPIRVISIYYQYYRLKLSLFNLLKFNEQIT